MNKKYTFEVWERVGFVTVTADNEEEAAEFAEEYQYDEEHCDFNPFNDGQYYEIR